MNFASCNEITSVFPRTTYIERKFFIVDIHANDTRASEAKWRGKYESRGFQVIGNNSTESSDLGMLGRRSASDSRSWRIKLECKSAHFKDCQPYTHDFLGESCKTLQERKNPELHFDISAPVTNYGRFRFDERNLPYTATWHVRMENCNNYHKLMPVGKGYRRRPFIINN